MNFHSLLVMILAPIVANAVVVRDVQREFVVMEQKASSALARGDRLNVVEQIDEAGF